MRRALAIALVLAAMLTLAAWHKGDINLGLLLDNSNVPLTNDVGVNLVGS